MTKAKDRRSERHGPFDDTDHRYARLHAERDCQDTAFETSVPFRDTQTYAATNASFCDRNHDPRFKYQERETPKDLTEANGAHQEGLLFPMTCHAISKIWRSSPFKIAMAFATAVTVITFAVFMFVSWKVSNTDIAQVRTVLEDESAKAVNLPSQQLTDQLDLRLTHDLRRLDYVGLFDSAGHLIHGNIGHEMAIPIDGKAHLTREPLGETDEAKPAVFVGRRLSDGNVLVLGRSLIEIFHLQETLRFAFVAAVLPTALIALVLGVIVSRSASRRLLTIQEAISRVMRGELHVRLPSREKSDDINELVGAVNLMLDEIVRLLTQIKSVGDNIAHDLKTPLTVMRARLERALDGASHAALVEAAREALSNLDTALTTVTALLRISELESGMQRRAFTNVDLAEICRDVYDMYEALGDAKSISMALNVSHPCVVFGDGDLLREAVANLLDNAVKFTPSGGTIIVDCNRDGALVRVSDTGPGIPPDEREKVFKRFYRLKQTWSVPGAGLGLSMAATIVALHGYVLRIDDNNPGAVFELLASNDIGKA